MKMFEEMGNHTKILDKIINYDQHMQLNHFNGKVENVKYRNDNKA